MLSSYIKDISKFSLLTLEEEKRLTISWKDKKDRLAFDKLVNSNLRLVIDRAKDFVNLGISIEDLIQEGNLGLMEGAKRFDYRKGVRFSTYVRWWIDWAIYNALNSQTKIIHIPVNKLRKLEEIKRATEIHTQYFGTDPSISDLADATDMTEHEVAMIIGNSGKPVQLSEIEPHEEQKILDRVETNYYVTDLFDSLFTHSSLSKDITRMLGCLPEREKRVLFLYYGIEQLRSLSLEEVGEVLGLTRERVRQIKDLALNKLYTLYGDQLRQYL
jgi:RNA polymerase primary sigma factor